MEEELSYDQEQLAHGEQPLLVDDTVDAILRRPAPSIDDEAAALDRMMQQNPGMSIREVARELNKKSHSPIQLRRESRHAGADVLEIKKYRKTGVATAIQRIDDIKDAPDVRRLFIDMMIAGHSWDKIEKRYRIVDLRRVKNEEVRAEIIAFIRQGLQVDNKVDYEVTNLKIQEALGKESDLEKSMDAIIQQTNIILKVMRTVPLSAVTRENLRGRVNRLSEVAANMTEVLER